MNRVLGFFAVAAVSVSLSGCGSSTAQMEDIALVTGKAGTTAQKGIAVLKVSLAGRCPYGTITIGRSSPKGYVAVAHANTVNAFLVKRETVQVSLEPGKFHVLSYTCQSGRYIVTVGQSRQEGSFFTAKHFFDKSFASFDVVAGQVTNVGHLRFASQEGMAGVMGGLDASVSDLSPKAKTQLKAKSPKLFAQMTTRLMVKGKKTISPALQKMLCDIGKTLKSKDAKTQATVDKMCKNKKKA